MFAALWSTARACRGVAAPVTIALALGGCAAGQGQDTDNPFSTAPPQSDTGTPVTDVGSGSSAAGSTGGPTEGSATGPADTSVGGPTGDDSTSEPVDPTENPDPDCIDGDGDGYGENCQSGADCDDNDYNNHSDAGCRNCKDGDGDAVWVSCDQYGADKPGPDCDDDNNSVGGMDAEELCNGIAENCAGEIDPLPADEMCPTNGDAPNVAGVGGWMCNAVAPGADGCEIIGCSPGYYDANKAPDDGCECVGTDREKSLDACPAAPKALLGVFAEGGVLPPLKRVRCFFVNGPAIVPARATAVPRRARPPRAERRATASATSSPVSASQPAIRTEPASASAVTQTRSPYATIARSRKAGSRNAAVPISSRSTPRATASASAASSRRPPPTWRMPPPGRAAASASIAARWLAGRTPLRAASRSITWRCAVPSRQKPRATASGSSP